MSELKEKEKVENSGSEEDDYDPEQQVVGDWKLCDLPEIPVVTGQQDEETMVKMRSKIYRWRGQWKERGIGELKILRNKQNNVQRILVRAQKTHKCIVNHYLQQKDIFCKLEQMKTSNNAWTWAAYDISDQKPENEKFCAKFTSKEDFEKFREVFENACKQNEESFKKIKQAEKAQQSEPKQAAQQKKQ